VPRNAEVIRQWTILREIERARGGATIDQLASQCAVTTRTIRRDLQALEEAGFPLYDDRSREDGRTRWMIRGQAFAGLAAGLTLSELCALSFSRTLLSAFLGAPFQEDVEGAFTKLASSLPPHMRRFLDRLPDVIATKRDPLRKREHPRQRENAARLLDGVLHLRQASITYDSESSARTKTYLVHPYRLAHAQGGLYLLAFVPEYGEMRTFALERLRAVTLLEERFAPTEHLPDEAFPHSLGVHSGPPERVEIEFHASVAAYVTAREWHRSQRLRPAPHGGVRMSLDVSIDRALYGWILSFGPAARVISPARVVREVAAQLVRAHTQYEDRSRNA
jgi:predicted DNA-binding transcriptional regulator YafY